MPEFSLVYTPRAQRDFRKLPPSDAERILDDLERLSEPQKNWPWNQVKRLHGHPYWEMKTGDFRSIFILQRQKIVVLRVINRRELEREVKRIDWRWLMDWLKKI